MKNNKPIYPEILITDGQNHKEEGAVEYSTNIRLKAEDGKWYTTIIRVQAFPEREAARHFIKAAHRTQNMVVTAEMIAGPLSFVLDEDQRSEAERLRG